MRSCMSHNKLQSFALNRHVCFRTVVRDPSETDNTRDRKRIFCLHRKTKSFVNVMTNGGYLQRCVLEKGTWHL